MYVLCLKKLRELRNAYNMVFLIILDVILTQQTNELVFIIHQNWLKCIPKVPRKVQWPIP